MSLFDNFRFWGSSDGDDVESEEETSEELSYNEELDKLWEDVQEIDDPLERGEMLNERLSGKPRNPKSEAIVSAVASDMASDLDSNRNS